MTTMHQQTVRLDEMFASARNRGAGAYGFVVKQPSWITRCVLLAIGAVLVVPFLVLLMLALAAGIVVFAVLASYNWISNRVRGGLFKGNEGRKNVRVIERR